MSEAVAPRPGGHAAGSDDSAAVAEIVALIVGGVDDDRLRWTQDRSSCRLVTDVVAPEGLRRTCEERARRFNEALRVGMAGTGWTVSGGWWRRPRP